MGEGGKGPTASSTTPWTGAEPALFQLVLVPGLSADNNLAERSLRPLVVIRKISGGSRSDEGPKTRMALASLFETWRAQDPNPFVECLKLLSQSSLPYYLLNSPYPKNEQLPASAKLNSSARAGILSTE